MSSGRGGDEELRAGGVLDGCRLEGGEPFALAVEAAGRVEGPVSKKPEAIEFD